MRLSISAVARPAATARAATWALAPRRHFASSPAPVDRSKDQAHPVGAFYQAIMAGNKQPLPTKKPEEPPVTSKTSPAQPHPEPPVQPQKPAMSTPAPEKAPASLSEQQKDRPSGAGTKSEADASSGPVPAKRGRKPKDSSSTTTKSDPPKAKSVSPLSSSSSSTIKQDSSSSAPPSPLPHTSHKEKDAPSNAPAREKQADLNNESRAAVIFGSSLAGPAERAERAERLAAMRAKSRLVAGVLVPPKPEEPDNCCMSGCVNCVWDRYRDEMEEWAARTAEAEERLRDLEEAEDGTLSSPSTPLQPSIPVMAEGGAAGGAMSMDDDGGGSASNWDVAERKTGEGKAWDEELYKNVPVGIREFMKQEKRLKEKHLREGTLGG